MTVEEGCKTQGVYVNCSEILGQEVLEKCQATLLQCSAACKGAGFRGRDGGTAAGSSEV